ncbi:MAG: histone deacetylase [Bacillus thermozeamaize]|jgi:acetoin utilization protein AcuC|uniref:Acetoin utilization protein AcuC n=1 Tax=Bacillus thermozeamaize TaxID=230954 RepID=A0A1Y3PP53_9BACI|nr:MAG: histone deacetylase [Bacillus thermozeamaize]
MAKHNSAFVYSEAFQTYKFHNDHPFNQKRLQLTLDLIQKMKLIRPEQIITPRMATETELELILDAHFIQAVRQLDPTEDDTPTHPIDAEAYGLGTEDNPIFPGMYKASLLSVGGTLVATELVMEGHVRHALNLGGGLHHGLRNKAAGFCIFNDAAVAIAHIRKKYQARVLYIDTDAHHGDGVQWLFYDDPNVMTISIHETGRYLFPGTGDVDERGAGAGLGYSINLPLDAFTEDDSYIDMIHQLLPTAARSFRPDVIISQNGCDAHRFDPLTHLATSMRVFQAIPRLVHQLAHELCDGRWIALGGGGYDIWRVVPRAWALLWAEMNDIHLEDQQLPQQWLNQWQAESPVTLPPRLFDPPMKPIPRRQEIEAKNRRTLERLLWYVPKA